MRGLNHARLAAAVTAIDAANAADPTTVSVRDEWQPLAFAHGRLAYEWVQRLAPDDEAALLAARAHHLRRWELPRSDYRDGRAGYLQWRRDQKARHARDVAALLGPAGYDDAEIARVQALIRREHLGSDASAQAVEDAACLAFIETQLAEMSTKLEHDHLLDVIRKTAAKMSPAALALVGEIPLSPPAATALADALG